MFDALTDDQTALARLRLCSRRDNGWRSPLVQLIDNAEVADYYPGRLGMTAPGRPTHRRWHGDDRTLTTHVFLPTSLLE